MKNIATAFVKAQKGFAPALKTANNPHFRSKYADLASCVEAVIDSLNANGIALLQQTHECADGVIVETVLLHESGEQITGGKLHVPAAKHDPQGYGSALTYARRYSLMAACGIAPEDDDGNEAVRGTNAEDRAFEDQHLDSLRNAAFAGMASLEAAFKAIPASAAKSRFWTKHQQSLKGAAK
jgi:hypothetical protein